MTAPSWRADLARRRSMPCPACGHTGPHAARCTPWYATLWGDVRCVVCDRFVDWIAQPPKTDLGAAKLYATARGQVAAMDALEQLLDSLGLRWPIQTRPPSHMTLTDERGAPPRLSATEARALLDAVQAVRDAFGWDADAWLWHEARHTHRREQAITHPGQAKIF